MEPTRVERKLTAILSADVKGYSRLMGEDEVATVRILTAYRNLMASLIQQYRGRVVDTPGDNLLAEFTSVVDAVQCAVEIQRELKTRNAELPDPRKMEFRIGVNLGDVIVERERIYGDGVNIAARVEGLAEGGGICVSGTVYEHVKNKLALGYESLGEHTVKNIAEPVWVFRIPRELGTAGPRVSREKRAVPRHRQWAALAAVTVLVVGVGAVAIWNFYLRPSPPPVEVPSKEKMAIPVPEKPSIAVLPFTNMSGDPEQEYFSDGITEDIITDLSKISGLFVIARTSVFTYKGRATKVQQVAEDLGVRYVLEGSVRKAGGRVRITAQLVDATTGNHLWAERYDRDLKDIFAVQEEVTQKVVSALAVTLKGGEQKRLPRKHTPNQEAHDLYLRANRLTLVTKERTLDARRMFERAIERDPDFAGGYAGSSWTHSMAVQHGFTESPREDVIKAYELAQRAMALDDTLGWSYMALARAYLMKGQHDQAVAIAEKAVQLQPSDADAHGYLGLYLMWAGRAEEAIAPIKKALRLNPQVLFSTGPYLNFSGFAYVTADRYGEAISAFEESAKRGGATGIEALAYSAAAYSELGKEQEARATVQKLLEKDPDFSLRSWVWLRLYKNLDDWKRLLNVFRKAGLPEFGLGQAADKQAYVYVFNEGSGDISIIDTKAQEVIATVNAGLRIRWFSSRFFDGRRVWTVDADPENAQVIVFDPWTLQTVKRIPFGKGPSMSVELSPDLKFAVTISPGTDEVVVIDTATYEIVRRIPVGKFPCDLTLSLDGKLAFEPDREQDTLSVLDWRSGKTLKTIALETGSKPHMLTLSPDGRQLWVQERDSGKLSIYDTKTFKRVARFPVGRSPITTEFTLSGRSTLTTHAGESFLKVFDAGNLKEVKTIQVDQSPVNSIFEPAGRYAYVTNWGGNTVSVIDVERWEVVKTIKVGRKPFGIYLFDPSQGKMAGNR